MRRPSSACSACEPCEKFSRAASIPAAIKELSTSGVDETGPSVATIFVLRGLSAIIFVRVAG